MTNATYEKPTVVIDANEAAILKSLAMAYVTDNNKDLTAANIHNWMQLIKKLDTVTNI